MNNNNYNNNYTHLVFSCGGIYGISFMGGYTYLYKHNFLANINTYSGCSAGAIFALIACLDLSLEEMSEIIDYLDYSNFCDINILNFNDKLGLDDGSKFISYIDNIIYSKIGKKDATFNDLHIYTKKILYISAVCLTDNKIEYFSVSTHPDLSVALAIRMSTCIPIIFTPITYNNKVYIDGGILESLPLHYAESKNTLCLNIKHTISCIKPSLETYCIQIYLCMFINLNKKVENNFDVIDISLPNMNILTLSLPQRIKKRLYKYGYRAARNFAKINNI